MTKDCEKKIKWAIRQCWMLQPTLSIGFDQADFTELYFDPALLRTFDLITDDEIEVMNEVSLEVADRLVREALEGLVEIPPAVEPEM